MLHVKTPDEVLRLIGAQFPPSLEAERVPLKLACGRILSETIVSREYVPDFDRSTVDGFAVRAGDTFGSSDAIPAVLTLSGEIEMGQPARESLRAGCAVAVPTGGAVPASADAVVMLEYTEDYGDGTIGVTRPAAPGENMIFRGDDVRPGDTVLERGRRLLPPDIGALAALGAARVPVFRRPVVGILSTGDELVPVSAAPARGQVRDVNAPMLHALCAEAGARAHEYGIIPDQRALLRKAVARVSAECDVVLLSGGSSVGAKDAACAVIEELGEILVHGIAMKPGKPTILGKIQDKPVMGLPGHPVAAFFVSRIFLRALLAQLAGRKPRAYTLRAALTENISANHGRAQYSGVRLTRRGEDWQAAPIHGKSGLITTLAATDGYICVPRECEGLAAGTIVEVSMCAFE